jgi:hypothetical protein
MGPSSWFPLLANLPGLFLLGYFTYRMGRYVLEPYVAALAGILVLLFPLVAWTSRESLLDCSLSGWVALAFYLVLRSDRFQRKGPTLLFGLAVGLGMLCKWTFVLFLTPAAIYAFVTSSERKRSFLNLLDAALIAVPVFSWWYLPNLRALLARFQLTAAGAQWEQDPGLLTLGGWFYYVRSISSYYLFLPLSLALLYALWCLLRGSRSDSKIAFFLCSAFGSIFVLTLLEAKDPRYIMPVSSLLAVILLCPWKNRPRAALVIVAFCFVQFLSVSFTLPFFPGKIAVLAVQNDTDYLGMSREWVFYQPDYFGVTGPPRQENWRLGEILERMGQADRVGFVPDSAFFHPVALELKGLFEGKQLMVERLGNAAFDEEHLLAYDWIVGKTGRQGISFITRSNDRVYTALEKLSWPQVEEWDLPDGSKAKLWRNPTHSR